VLDRLVSTVKVEARSFATTLICGVIAGMSGVVAVLFIGIAIFIWAADRYGSLQASLAMAGFFLVVALIAIAILFYARSAAAKRAAKRAEEERREREEAAKNAPPVWMDPALIPKLLPMLLPVVLKAAQIGIKHRGLLIAAISSAAVGWAMLRERGTPEDDEMPAAEQPAE
jgi:membrane protein implicated in regulation of membrane protease activity